MYTLQIKVTSEEKDREKQMQRELEDFLYRYRDFLNPATARYDPVKIRRFKIELREILQRYDVDFATRMRLETMMRNVRLLERKRIVGEDVYSMWYYSPY